MNYYTITGTPTLWFNGTTTLVGAGPATATGEQYMDIIRSRYFDAAPIRIDVDLDSATGDTTATVTMYSSSFVLDEDMIHLVLTEDDVTSTYTHVTRDVYSDTISLSGAANTAVFNHTFTIDPSWNEANLRVVGFVQLDDHTIVQTGTSDEPPDYKVRAIVPFARNDVGPSSGGYETDWVTVMNIGLDDDYTIDIVTDIAPAGWTAAFVDESLAVHTDPLAFDLLAEESTTFKALITPDSPGYAEYRLVIDSDNLADPLEIPFVFITDDVAVLVVDDDGGEDFEDYFAAALEGAGISYGVWNRSVDALTPEVAETFDVLVWNVGWSFPSLDEDDKLFLADYLDTGKALFLSGQDIGWELNDPNGSPDPVWYQTYLHATYIRDNTGILALDGVPGDPVSDGLSIDIDGGTGASNQDFPDEIEAADADATEIFYYQGDGCGAIRAQDSTSRARLVYLGFGFEGIADVQDREDLMTAAIAWITTKIFADGFESGGTTNWDNVVD